MSSSPLPCDASASALGYLYQCRYALLLALRKGDDPNSCVSIEKLDDVAFHESPSTPDLAVELLQFKHHLRRRGGLGDSSTDLWKSLKIWAEAARQRRIHHLRRRGGLGDSSTDLWKSLKIWAEAARQRRIDLSPVTLCLVTTSTAGERNAVRFLRTDPSVRNPLKALEKLTLAGSKSRSATVQDAFGCLTSLPLSERQAMFQAAFLLDNSQTATDIEGAIGASLRYAVHPRHREGFLQRLEGWWLQTLVRHLSESIPVVIPVSLIQGQVFEIQEQFRRESLPDDQWNAILPDDASPDNDDRIFVQQLRLIGLSATRIRYAQEDHYRAFAQRSRWAKDELLDLEEVSKYESRIVDGWRERFAIVREGVTGDCDDRTKARHGRSLYDWIVTEAPSRPALWVRPNFQSQYMTKGSYQMLSDQLRVGWHPEYERHFRSGSNGSYGAES